MATTNALQWNPTAVNQETDAQYLADSQRAGGATDPSVFLSLLANKAYFQWSTYITALFQAFAAKGFTTSDSNLNTLTATCANFLTTADVKPPQVSVPFSPTPVFDCSLASSFRIALTGNVTSSTLVNIPPAGELITFFIVSNPGVYSFVWPVNVVDARNVQTESVGNLFTEMFISDGGNLYPAETFLTVLAEQVEAAQSTANTAVTNASTAQGAANAAQGTANTAIAEIAALSVAGARNDVTGGRAFGATYTNTSGGPMWVTGYGNTNGGGVGSVACFVNGDADFAMTGGATASGGAIGFSFVVPNGATYGVFANTMTDGGNAVTGVGRWIETVVTI